MSASPRTLKEANRRVERRDWETTVVDRVCLVKDRARIVTPV